MKDHIKKVNRYDPRYFAGRMNRIYAMNPDFSIDWSKDPAYVPVPYDVIICDAYNATIDAKTVNLLVLSGHVWGTVCEGCKTKYHVKLPVVKDDE